MTKPEQTTATSTLIITNLMKLIGAGVFINEAVFERVARNSVLAVCALFVLGAQVAENIVLSLIARMFEKEEHGLERKSEPNGLEDGRK